MARGQSPASTGTAAARDGGGRPAPSDAGGTGYGTEHDAGHDAASAAERADVVGDAPDPDAPPPVDPPDDRDGDPGGPGDPDGWPGEARWVRPFLVVAGVVGLLLLGAAAGLLIGVPGRDAPIVPGPDSVDVGFAQDMTVHHQQAVEMAAWERDHSTDPVVRQLASDIETTQNSQIGRMQGWLELWNAAPLPVGGHMAWMAGPDHDHGGGGGDGTEVATMPGMASTEDLAALRAATGPQLDVLFLQLMLRHHEGGVGMLEHGAEHAAVPQLRNLARQMLSSQTSESDYMRQLLAERGAQPLSW